MDWNGNNKSVYATLGASNHSSREREHHDYYATDPIAVDSLFSAINLPNAVWECACGEGHLSRRMIELGRSVYSSDIIDRGYGDVLDFLSQNYMPKNCKCIITNPPYKFALEFVLHSLELLPEGCMCAMFLKTTFLEGQKRYEKLFKNTPHDICCNSQKGLFAQRMETFSTHVAKEVPWLTHGIFGKKDLKDKLSLNGYK